MNLQNPADEVIHEQAEILLKYSEEETGVGEESRMEVLVDDIVIEKEEYKEEFLNFLNKIFSTACFERHVWPPSEIHTITNWH